MTRGVQSPWLAHLEGMNVIEFRRYTLRASQQRAFAAYFDAYFPEAHQQLGGLVLGQFIERDNPLGFVWLRAYKDMDARAAVNTGMYSGPIWKEHASTMNCRIEDASNVLLMQPLAPEHSVTLLPAVDPLTEPQGARGAVVALICQLKPGQVERFARAAEPVFAALGAAGIHEAGRLVTLDAVNNYPRLPIRSDGPFLIWLGRSASWEALESMRQPSLERLRGHASLQTAPEWLALEPTARSRLRWLEETHGDAAR